MAKRRTTRRRRSSTRRRSAPRRRTSARRISTTRRRRRRRNPSFRIIEVLIGAAAGAVAGAGAYALAGQDLSPTARAGIAGGVGVLGGTALTALNPSAGAGFAGGGAAIAALQLLSHYMTESPKQTQSVRRMGAVAARLPNGQVIQMAGARAPQQMRAVAAPIGGWNQWAMMNGIPA